MEYCSTSIGIVLLLSLCASVDSFIVFSPGVCPQVDVKQNFNISAYEGRWFSYQNFDAPYQFGMSCVTANYKLLPDNTIQVINEGFSAIRVFGMYLNRRPIQAVGAARVLDWSDPARLRVAFGQQPDFSIGAPKPNYQVIDTDYKTYSLVYSCSSLIVPFKLEGAWILTRTRGARPVNTEELKNKLASYGVKIKYFKMVDHNNC